jgi:hypothetical protein
MQQVNCQSRYGSIRGRHGTAQSARVRKNDRMRVPFAQDVVLSLAPEADIRAPGGAITAELCGHWEHAPPCPLAPHYTAAQRRGSQVHLRILFATEPEREADVRTRIGRALGAWDVRSCAADAVRPDERVHAGQLVAAP